VRKYNYQNSRGQNKKNYHIFYSLALSCRPFRWCRPPLAEHRLANTSPPRLPLSPSNGSTSACARSSVVAPTCMLVSGPLWWLLHLAGAARQAKLLLPGGPPLSAPLLPTLPVRASPANPFCHLHPPARASTSLFATSPCACVHTWLRVMPVCGKSNSNRWSKFDLLNTVIGCGVKIFSSLKQNLLQQFPYSPSQLVAPTMLPLLLLSLSKSWIFGS
jgi:hypothetical protein